MPPSRAMPVVTWYWVKNCPWGCNKDYKFSCTELTWKRADKTSRSRDDLQKKLVKHSEGSGLHWNAPTAMMNKVVEQAMRTKVCYADFDEDDNMIAGTEVTAESSDEESADEDYKAMMLDRKKTQSPKRESGSPHNDEKKKKDAALKK